MESTDLQKPAMCLPPELACSFHRNRKDPGFKVRNLGHPPRPTGLGISGAAVVFPVAFSSGGHGFAGVVQPAGGALLEVAENGGNGEAAAEVDVGCFPAHGVEQAFFVALDREHEELDA